MKRKMRDAARALALLGALSAHGAHADEGMSWKFRGFGTVGAVMTNTDEAQFRSSWRQTRGAGKSPDLGVDSRLGVQANVNFNSTFSAVGQLLVRNRDGGKRLQVEWLFGQASVTPWLDLRAGRMVLPVFLLSDSLNVGYATHWARAPTEVYSIYPASSFDGAQAQAHTDWGGTHFTLQASAGTTKADLVLFGAKVNADFKKLYSLNLVAEQGNWTLRVGDTEVHDSVVTGADPVPPYTDSFRGVGITYDNGKALVQAEYVRRRTSDPGAVVHIDMNAYYVTGGYRMGRWMPYATYSRFEPVGSSLRALGLSNTRTVAAGLRWDAYQDVAVKAQVESVQSNGFNFVNEGPAFFASAFSSNPRKVNVFTLLADFVF